jgi:drug/metabolite transporter (DMT)-like permease
VIAGKPAWRTGLRAESTGVLFALLGASSYGVGNILSKLAFERGVTVPTLVFVRFLVGSVLLWFVVAALRLDRRPAARRWLPLAGLGLTYTVQSFLLQAAFSRIPVALAALLLYTYPAMVGVGAAALRIEAWHRMRGVALAASLAGTAIVLGTPIGRADPVGVACALGAAFLLAFNTLAVSRIGRTLHPLTMGAYIMTGGLLASGAVALARRDTDFGLNGVQWILLLSIGILTTAVAATAILAAIKRLGPARSSIGSTFEPVVTIVLAALILSERLGPAQLVGAGLIVSAVAMLPFVRSREAAGPVDADDDLVSAGTTVAANEPSRRA